MAYGISQFAASKHCVPRKIRLNQRKVLAHAGNDSRQDLTKQTLTSLDSLLGIQSPTASTTSQADTTAPSPPDDAQVSANTAISKEGEEPKDEAALQQQWWKGAQQSKPLRRMMWDALSYQRYVKAWVGDAVASWSYPVCRYSSMTSEGQQYLDPATFVQGGLTESRAGAPSDPDSQDYNVPTVPPRLTFFLLAMNLSVYSAGVYIALTVGNDASNEYFLALAKSNEAVLQGEYWRLMTATFLHAGILHLGLNCYALYMLGTEVEAVMGYGTFLAVYLLSGLSGSIASFALVDDVTVGASGAIFGLLGALFAYFVKNYKLQNSGRQLLYLVAIIALNLILGAGQDSLIDNTGHVGGFVAGAVLGFSMGPRYVAVRELQIPDGSIDVPPDAKEQQVVVDQTTALQRALALVSFSGSLLLALVVALGLRATT